MGPQISHSCSPTSQANQHKVWAIFLRLTGIALTGDKKQQNKVCFSIELTGHSKAL